MRILNLGRLSELERFPEVEDIRFLLTQNLVKIFYSCTLLLNFALFY